MPLKIVHEPLGDHVHVRFYSNFGRGDTFAYNGRISFSKLEWFHVRDVLDSYDGNVELIIKEREYEQG